MPDPDEKLLPSNPDEVALTLRNALLINKKRRFDSARDHMANITAAHLLEALRQSGYIIMKRPINAPLNHWPTAPKGE